MVVFPALSAVIACICAGMVARDAVARPRPDKIAWAIAFAIFAVAAGCEVAGSVFHWTPGLARLYYLTGAVLVVGYLALGELYLLAAERIRRVAPGATLLVTAVAASIVFNAGVDHAKLAADGWEAIERGPALIAIAIAINSLGTLVLVGGLGISALGYRLVRPPGWEAPWHFQKVPIQRNRAIGCALIAAGTIMVGLGGTLTRLGHREYLYIPMSIGIAVIFLGYLRTRAPTTPRAAAPAASTPVAVPIGSNGSVARPAKPNGASNGHHPAPVALPADPGIAFIEARLATLDAAALAALCREWSVEPHDVATLPRDDARRAWALRVRLSPPAQERFDALPLPTRLQLTDLYHEVITVTTVVR